jgi:hypothetical protein
MEMGPKEKVGVCYMEMDERWAWGDGNGVGVVLRGVLE